MWSESCQMLDEYYSRTKEVKITDCDTIVFPGVKEMTMEKFFDFFEKGIKNYQITECGYDVEKNILTFNYNNNQFKIPMENTYSGDGVILLNLVKLEEELRRQKKYEEELLEEARSGNICSEEARQLYMKELKKSISFKENMKKNKKIVSDVAWDADHLSGLLFILGILFAVFSGVLGIGALFDGYLKEGIWSLVVCVTSIGASIGGYNDINIFEFLVLWLYRSIKQIVEDTVMVNHKLKYLRKYQLPKDAVFSKITVDSFNESVRLKIHEIYEKLNKLNEKEGSLLKGILANKVNEVKEKIAENSNVDDINSEFLRYLLEFEREIDKIIGVSDNDKKSYAFTGNARGMVATENTTKVRRKI